MRRAYAVILSAFLCGAACDRFSLPREEFVPFELVAAPEERVWYPEETPVFTFSLPVNPDTGGAVEVTYAESAVHDTQVEIVDNTVTLSGLLADAVLTVTIKSTLKSTDHKPLTRPTEEGYASGALSFTYTVGSALPTVAAHLPEQHLRSKNRAILFSAPVDIAAMTVTPKPAGIVAEGGRLLLSFSAAPDRITITGLSAEGRPGAVPDVELKATTAPAPSEEPLLVETVDDTSVTLKLSGAGLVAVATDDQLVLCGDSCELVRDGLLPDTAYPIPLTLYRTDTTTKLTHTAATAPPAPHIMISEVMHTPAGEPEKNWEFVELYNYGTLDFDLTGCLVDDRDDGKGADPLIPLVEGDMILRPGEFALILGGESTLHLTIHTSPHIYFVDDTTIADGGLTSTESISVSCIVNEQWSREAYYDGLFKGTARGYSVTIDTDGRVCASKESGGSPGAIQSCGE